MERRLRTNLVLVAVLAAAGAFIFLGPEPEPDSPGVPLFEAGEEISRIAVEENGETRFVLEQADRTWKLAAPFGLPADSFQVNAFLESLRQPAARRYPLADADPVELGLDTPQWIVKVNDAELRIGDRAALGNSRYVQKDGYVYLVSDVLSYRLRRDPLDYAGKRLLPEDVVLSAIQLPDGTRVVKAGNAWSLRPDDETVSADAIQGLVNAWRNATATDVRAADSVPRDGDVLLVLVTGEELRFGVEITETTVKLTRDEPAITYNLPREAASSLLRLTPSADE